MRSTPERTFPSVARVVLDAHKSRRRGRQEGVRIVVPKVGVEEDRRALVRYRRRAEAVKGRKLEVAGEFGGHEDRVCRHLLLAFIAVQETGRRYGRGRGGRGRGGSFETACGRGRNNCSRATNKSFVEASSPSVVWATSSLAVVVDSVEREGRSVMSTSRGFE